MILYNLYTMYVRSWMSVSVMTTFSLSDITDLQYCIDYQFVYRLLSVSVTSSIIITHWDQGKSNEGMSLLAELCINVFYVYVL